MKWKLTDSWQSDVEIGTKLMLAKSKKKNPVCYFTVNTANNNM